MIEVYSLLIAGGVALSLGMVSLFRRSVDRSVRYFFMTMISAAVWAIGLAIFLGTTDSVVATYAAVVYYIAAAAIALTLLLLSMSLESTKKRHMRHILAVSVPFLLISIALLAYPSILFEQVVVTSDGAATNSIQLASIPYALYGLYFVSYFVAAIYILWRRYRTHTTSKNRFQQRLLYVSLAYLLAGIVGIWFNLILPGLGEYKYVWVGPLGLLILAPIIYVAIVRFGLFDIRRAASITLAYVLTLAVLMIPYVALTEFFYEWLARVSILSGDEMSLAIFRGIVLIGVILLFQPLRQMFDRFTDRLFYRRTYHRDEFYAELNTILTTTFDMKKMLTRVTKLFERTFNAEPVFFVIKGYQQSRTHSGGKIAAKDIEWLDEYVMTMLNKNEPLIHARLSNSTQDRTLQRLMISHKLELIFPLLHQQTVEGYVCMGERANGMYSKRDIVVLRNVVDELMIAIQNVRSIHEIRELNATLQQRVDEATQELRRSNAQLMKLDEAKDEFISMASHQLRTPLTSVKGYIDMILQGDAGKVTTTQRTFLTEAFASSERMVHLINDFLNVSRLQTGKFVIEKRPVDLTKVVAQELDSLTVSASQHELKFKYKSSKQVPLLMLDEAKIRQVIMNFADNALYYSTPGTTIAVSLKAFDDRVELRVKDTGIGVPKDEQAKLFTKFFRATNARRQRPDGTGVGLYLAKRVVSAHGGAVIFESTEGKGSTFGFSLPLDRLRSSDDTDKLDQ